MKLTIEDFDSVKRYLLYDKKLRDGKKNEDRMKSRYRVLCSYFEDKEFTRTNFLGFLEYMLDKGYSKAYMNVLITMAKHLDKHFGINELQDFTRYPKEDKFVDVFTADEFKALADVELPYRREARETNAKYRALVYILFYTGARINEVLELRWDDVRETPFPVVIFNQSKIYELRYAPIPLSLYVDLQHLPHYSGYVFSNKDGIPMDRTTVSDALKQRAIACGISKRTHPHLLRHSFINIMLRNGAGLEQVSRLVGHKTLETTNRHYVHMMIEELNDVLHTYHPDLKKHQTIETITKRVREMLVNVLDTERFNLNVFKKRGQVQIEIKEITDD